MNLPSGLSIPQEDWDRTPISVQAVIITQIVLLQEQIGRLESEVARLQEQVNRNSHNSSKPSSNDGPQKRNYPKPEPSGKKKGDEKGITGTSGS
jgi:hypothetical protein